VYRTENRWEEALQLAQTFHEKEPENPVAASEYALALAVTGRNPKQALSVLIDAFERSKEGTAHSSLINAVLQVGACLLVQGFVLPVVAVGNQLKRFPTVQESANALLYRASSMVEFPILLRDLMFEHICPENFPGKTEFEDAIELLSLMRWKEGLAKLESLTQYADTWSAIWRDVAAVRFWLLENEKGCEALQTFAALPNTSFEDAVDAEATRLFLTPNALGDQMEILYIEYPINDAEKAYEKLLSKPEFYSIPLKLKPVANVPPPKGGFMLLDHPLPAKETEITIDNVASQFATILFFGRETDREARIIVMELLAGNRQKVEQVLKETLGDLIRDASDSVTHRTVPLSHAKIQLQFRYSPEIYPTTETLEKLETDYYEKIFTEFWCNLPLGFLDGKTPNETASDPAYRIRILGAIQMMEFWVKEDIADEFANRLRSKLGLPTHELLTIPNGSEEEILDVLDAHPVWRWYRFEVEKLPTSFLTEGLQIVAAMKELRASRKFAKELLDRPMNGMPIQIRFLAFESLIAIAKESNRLEEALNWIEKAKNESAANNIADAGWCLHEIPIFLTLGQFEKSDETIQYLVKKYGRDEKVMQALHKMFVQLGFINPDGTPSAAMTPSLQAEAAVQPAGLWTPDAQTPAAGGGTKLWTPD
jgi:hypothetical protein